MYENTSGKVAAKQPENHTGLPTQNIAKFNEAAPACKHTIASLDLAK